MKEFRFNTRLHGSDGNTSSRFRQVTFKISKTLTVRNITASQTAANPSRQLSRNFHLITLSTGGTDRCVPALVCVCVSHR